MGMIEGKKNYIPGSMSLADGFLGPRGDVGFVMVYDHEKTKSIINELLQSDKKITEVYAGLDGDWDENSCVVYDGEFHNYTSYEESIWATPTLIVNFSNAPSEAFEVWSRKEK